MVRISIGYTARVATLVPQGEWCELVELTA
jgi:hypothetical protein